MRIGVVSDTHDNLKNVRQIVAPDAQQGPLSWLERNVWEFGRYLARNLNF